MGSTLEAGRVASVVFAGPSVEVTVSVGEETVDGGEGDSITAQDSVDAMIGSPIIVEMLTLDSHQVEQLRLAQSGAVEVVIQHQGIKRVGAVGLHLRFEHSIPPESLVWKPA